VDKETLFKRRAADTLDTIDLEDFVVTVRGLSRGEVNKAREFEDDEKQARLIVTMGLVDPQLTAQEVAEWFDLAPAGDTIRVLDKIAELSGLAEDARKSDHAKAE
jgi:hypothetical protein